MPLVCPVEAAPPRLVVELPLTLTVESGRVGSDGGAMSRMPLGCPVEAAPPRLVVELPLTMAVDYGKLRRILAAFMTLRAKGRLGTCTLPWMRSEEHTSELQSL